MDLAQEETHGSELCQRLRRMRCAWSAVLSLSVSAVCERAVSLLVACSDNTLSGFASANKSLSSVGERTALEHWKPWQASSETVILLSLCDGKGGAWELSGAQAAVRVSCEMCPVASMVCKANSSATRIRSFLVRFMLEN